MTSALGLLGWLGLAFGAAMMGALFGPGDWYAELRKPTWNPPSWVFAPVWTALYASMGVAAWLIWRQVGASGRGRALGMFLVQLGLNALWSPLFFGLQSPGWALVNISLLWLALVGTVVVFWKVRPPAGLLLLPYLVWVSFASALNLAIWRLNS
ncbi:MAG: tryptophan-rich sensory protein [Verrucomicrobia bacterium]|nr:tryptophan-rich sensory protein [Verrucomicrobiota bacterium]